MSPFHHGAPSFTKQSNHLCDIMKAVLTALRLNAGSTIKFPLKYFYAADAVVLLFPTRFFFSKSNRRIF